MRSRIRRTTRPAEVATPDNQIRLIKQPGAVIEGILPLSPESAGLGQINRLGQVDSLAARRQLRGYTRTISHPAPAKCR